MMASHGHLGSGQWVPTTCYGDGDDDAGDADMCDGDDGDDDNDDWSF